MSFLTYNIWVVFITVLVFLLLSFSLWNKIIVPSYKEWKESRARERKIQYELKKEILKDHNPELSDLLNVFNEASASTFLDEERKAIEQLNNIFELTSEQKRQKKEKNG